MFWGPQIPTWKVDHTSNREGAKPKVTDNTCHRNSWVASLWLLRWKWLETKFQQVPDMSDISVCMRGSHEGVRAWMSLNPRGWPTGEPAESIWEQRLRLKRLRALNSWATVRCLQQRLKWSRELWQQSNQNSRQDKAPHWEETARNKTRIEQNDK
jgi:hypothetical protein